MANTDWASHVFGPATAEPANPETHPQSDSRPLVAGWHATKFHRAAAAEQPAEQPAEDAPAEDRAEPAEDALRTWIANPHTIRDYVRIDISGSLLDCGPGRTDNAAAVAANRGVLANIDTGLTVYNLVTEDRLTVTLFEVSLESAFFYFAELRDLLRSHGCDNDCARFYFVEDCAEDSHCAKKVAPYWYTIAAGLEPAQKGFAYAVDSTARIDC